MIKNGNVEIGKTPSEDSGKKSTLIKEGVALADGEEYNNPVKEITKIIDDHLKAELNKKGKKNA